MLNATLLSVFCSSYYTHEIWTITDFPLLMVLRVLATSINEGLSDGSSAQHCFIRLKMPGCTPADSSWGSGGRQNGVRVSLIFSTIATPFSNLFLKNEALYISVCCFMYNEPHLYASV